jgi:hypothetical protein
MKNNIVLLSGKISSGKSTVADYLVNHKNYVEVSFADNMKSLLQNFLEVSYNISLPLTAFYTEEGKQTILPVRFPGGLPSTVRGAMQWYGELMKAQLGETFWIKQLIYKLKTISTNIVISDARFTYEIDSIKNEASLRHQHKVATILIKSDRSPIDKHISENHLENYDNFDFILENNKSLNDLYSEIDKVIPQI